MYLKSIEVQGFKSFANKITLQFHDGITAIVGPNGSGKSNVSDAVRWVLGEQSAKQLRGSNMQDVIFSGTQQRKPLGFAHVAITFDNSDHKLAIEYDEVTIARRVFRSGESEYLINGSQCRLRDVQELFLDTGVGKEGYSLIGQGQIDRILSGKPEDKRELFDEAVGIVKFKKRKEACVRDLEIERQNLVRICDIITEIERQIEPLHKQSEVAKRYLELKEGLKNLEIGQFLHEYERFQSEIKKNDDRYRIVSGDYGQTEQDFNDKRSEYEQIELELGLIDADIEESSKRRNDLMIEQKALEGELNLLSEQISAIIANDDHYRERLSTIVGELRAKEDELGDVMNQKKETDDKLDELDDKQSETSERHAALKDEIARLNDEIAAHNAMVMNSLNINADIKTKMQYYTAIEEQNDIKRQEISKKILLGKQEEESLRKELARNESRHSDICADIKGIEGRIRDVNKKIAAMQQDVDGKNALSANIRKELITTGARLESIRNLTERYEGYGGSVRRIMEQKSVMPGIVGVVADIIKMDKDYETAIETALASNMQNVVTDSVNTAKELIGYLKRNKFGRATFLPLDGITYKKYDDPGVMKEKGVVGLACDLVSSDKQYKRLFEYLLGRTYVVDNIDDALAINKKYKYTLRMVTLEGEQLNPGGSMSGGAYRNASNLLGRRREIEELEKLEKKLHNDTMELEKALEDARLSRNALREQLQRENEDLNAKTLELNTFAMKLGQYRLDLAQNQEMLSSYNDELARIERQTESNNESMTDLGRSLDENAMSGSQNEAKLGEYAQLVEEGQRRLDALNDILVGQRMDIANLEQGNQHLMEIMRRIKDDIGKLTDEEDGIRANMLGSASEIRKREDGIKERRERLHANEGAIDNIERGLGDLDARKKSMNASHKNFFVEREGLSARMNELDKEMFRIQKQREKLTEQNDVYIEHIWSEYGLTPLAASEYARDRAIVPKVNTKGITGFKDGIRVLGDVNVNAIEDYKNLSERYAFLNNQHEDLANSEGKLVSLIDELDEEMRLQFAQRFQLINRQFDKVFKELFGGGTASLELVDDEDVLEAGIRVIAQPPGKKLQNMLQLSGGEKALTAICILFAIQNLKPSPFCLLDEIEAVLDDSNVKRFADYLHKMTRDTQFIIITHRRGTMSAANKLYGITMQEKGVSTLVSVDLIEDDIIA